MPQATDDHIRELNVRFNEMRTLRSPHEWAWEEIRGLTDPFRGEIQVAKHEGSRRVDPVFDSTAMQARETFTNFLKGQLFPSSDATWFRLSPPEELQLDGDAFLEYQDRLDRTRRRVLSELARSNFYVQAGSHLGDMATVGNAIMAPMEKGATLTTGKSTLGRLVFPSIPLRECFWKTDLGGEVEMFCREVCMTVLQAYRFFNRAGDDIGETARELLKDRPNSEVRVRNFLFSNENKVPSDARLKSDSSKKWVSQWTINHEEDGHLVRDAGFDRFPYVISRWYVVEEEEYGRGIGHLARPDSKGINELRRLILMAAGRDLQPPLLVYDEKHYHLSRAASRTVVSADHPEPKFMDVNTRYDVANVIATEDRAQIRGAFMSDALTDPETQPRSAEESIQRRERALQRLSAPAERVAKEFLDPLIDNVMQLMLNAGALPELESLPERDGVRYEYTSPFFQAQKASELRRVEAFLAKRVTLAAETGDPVWLNDIDVNGVAALEKRIGGLPASIFKSEEQTNAARVQQEQERMRAMRMEEMKANGRQRA